MSTLISRLGENGSTDTERQIEFLLAEALRRAKAEAWDEGFGSGLSDGVYTAVGQSAFAVERFRPTANPYKN